MVRRAALVGLVGLLVVLAGCAQDTGQDPTTSVEPSTATTDAGVETTTAAPSTTTTATPSTTTTDEPAAAVPPDPPTDRLGWEAGYWHNETLPITQEDGLNATELAAVVNRSKARVEQIRRLEFNRTVPVSVVSRETYQSEYAETNNTTATLRTFDNAKFEMLFLVGEDRDSLAVQESNRGSNVLGFYSPRDDEIVVVSESATPRVTETTLGHELVHALQFGQFNTSDVNTSTRELHNARNGVIEGDARYVDQIYSTRCDLEWSCTTQASSGGGGSSDLHLGIYIMKYFPYSDGPGFIASQRESGGWDGVNDVYANVPASAEQIIIPRKYGEDAPTGVGLPDRSSADWSRVSPAGRAPFGSVGQASITAMFAYPAYDQTRSAQPVIGPRQFLNVNSDGSVNGSDPIDYNVSYANGWDGDKLRVYENAEGETGYTWRITWDTEGDAREFVGGYRQLLQYWGGERVDDREDLWRIPEGESGYADAFGVQLNGDTVTLTNAPTVDDLTAVHSSAPSR